MLPKKSKYELTPSKLDTILYKGYRQHNFDTIICNISEAKSYKFRYNECCGAFNIAEEKTSEFLIGKVVFKLKNKTNNKTYLGTLGEAGILVESKHTDTLIVSCRSAMSPNIYQISLSEITSCSNSECETTTCLQSKYQKEPIWDYPFDIISRKINSIYAFE